MAQKDPCEGNPNISVTTYTSPDGKTAKIYKNTAYDKSWFTNFLNAAVLWHCWVFVQGYVLLYIAWLILPRWISIPFLVLYFVNMAISKAPESGGRLMPLCRLDYNMQIPSGYFQMRTLVEDSVKLDGNSQYMFGLHPHGAHCLGTQAFHLAPSNPLYLLFPRVLEKTHMTCASVMFFLPWVREVLMWYGWIVVSRKNLEKHLAKGSNLGIIVGGEAESILSENGKDKVVLEGRKGFVRLAVRYGVDLVPTYTFHLNETFTFNLNLLAAPRQWIQKNLKVCLPVLWGRWGTPVPHPAPLLVAVGAPIAVPRREQPGGEVDEAVVDRIHAQYMDALSKLFESYKGAAGYGAERKLEVLRAPEADRVHKKTKKES